MNRVNVLAQHLSSSATSALSKPINIQICSNDDGDDNDESTSSAAGNKKKKVTPIIPGKESKENPMDISRYPSPPMAPPLAEGAIFPQFPEMRAHAEKLNHPGLFSYDIAGGRRITIVEDPSLYKVIFFPDNEHLSANQAVLAYHWFGINKDMSQNYTTSSLQEVRKVLKQSKVRPMTDYIGKEILEQMKQLPSEGMCAVNDFAFFTFWPVNAAMFGPDFVNPNVCPAIKGDLDQYNASFEKVANGLPRSMFPDMEEAAQKMSSFFGTQIDKGYAEMDSCPVLKARLAVFSEQDKKKFTSTEKGRFIMSIFWAAQANTLPGTMWCIAMCLANPRVKAKMIEEARGPLFANQPGADGKYNLKPLKYTDAVVREVLRLKVANITHRKVHKEFALRTASGKTYRIPKGDTLTVSSYLPHHDETTFEDPYEFKPERWLQGKKYANEWIPFGGGPNTCSGKWLALGEIPTLLALFFREFDAELIDPLPEEDWENVVAMVGPKAGQACRMKFKKVGKASASTA